MLNEKNVLKLTVAAWIIIAVLYCAHTPYNHRVHDIWGHMPYTKIIITQHRLPHPSEGWESFQPPLYYLINSLIVPEAINIDESIHANYVRAFSVLYGAISLLIIGWFLKKFIKDPLAKFLSLIFIGTTPTYLFVFSTYNNDSLFTMLAIATIALSYKLYQNWSWKLASLLLILSTSAFYTKVMMVFTVATICICCCKNLLQKKLPSQNGLRIIATLAISFALLFPWAYFHNYRLTGKLFPSNAEESIDRDFDFVDFKNLMGLILKIPELQRQDVGFMTKVDYTHEWDDPWQHPNWDFLHAATKRFDYFGNSFVTSLIGEYIIEKPHVNFIWLIYLIHLFAYIYGLIQLPRSNLTKLAGAVVIISHFLQILTVPMFPDLPQRSMAYRYICWSWIGWAALYASALANGTKTSSVFNKALIVGIVAQIYILITMEGTRF